MSEKPFLINCFYLENYCSCDICAIIIDFVFIKKFVIKIKRTRDILDVAILDSYIFKLFLIDFVAKVVL